MSKPINNATVIQKWVHMQSFKQVVMASLVVAFCVVNAHAQGTTGNAGALVGALEALFQQLYNNFRLPICVIGLFYAGLVLVTDEVRGGRRALKIAAATAFITFVPDIYAFVESLRS